MKILVIIAFLGLCALTYFSQKRARDASRESEEAKIQMVEAKENLAASDRKLADYREREKERTTERDEARAQLAEIEKKTKEDAEKLAELQTNLENTTKQNEESKTQMTELENLQQKLKEAEEQNTVAKAELAKAQADLTAARADLQRVQTRPPLGGAMQPRRP